MTNLNIAKLYLANNTTASATEIDTAVTNGTANTAVQALSTAAFVEAAYQAAFGRAADAEGLAYWSNEIDANGMAKDDAFMTALNYGATVYVAPTVDAPLVIGTETFTAATVSATDDVVVAAAKATAEAAASSASVGSVAAAVVSVVDTTTAAAAIVVIDAADAAADATPSTHTLTTSTTDTLTGTANDDTIDAISSSLLTTGTLQITDTIDGGAGTDSANISLEQGFAGFTTGSMESVETLNLTNDSTGALAFSAAGITDVTKYVLDSAKGVVSLSAMSELAELEISGPVGTTAFTAAYAPTSIVATGTQTDIQKLTVTDVGTIDPDGVSGVNPALYMGVTIANVEGLDITTVGTSNSLTLSNVAATTIAVAGEGQTEISAVGSALTSFDASASTGNVIANLGAASANVVTVVKSGAGDDTISVQIDDLTANAAINGGTGADTLVITSNAAKTMQADMNGFETVNVNTLAAGALTFSGTNVTDIATLNIATPTKNVTFANMGSSAVTVNAIGAMANAVSVDNAGTIAYNMDVAAGATAAAQAAAAAFGNTTSLTTNVGAGVTDTGTITAANAADFTLNVASNVVGGAETTSTANVATVANAKTVTVNADGQLTGASQVIAAEALTATITTGSSAADTFGLTTAKLTNLTIDAGHTLTFAGTTNIAAVQTLDATVARGLTLGNFADAASVTLGGTAATSTITLGNLGGGTTTHISNLTATGLKAGLTVGTMNGSSSAIDISGVTGAITIGNIATAGDVSVDAANSASTVNLGTIASTNTNASLDVSATGAAVNVGTIGANANAGTATLNAATTVGAVAVGVMTGNAVVIDGSQALNGVVVGNGADAGATIDVNAKTSVSYKGTNLTNNGIDIQATANSTALTVTVEGGTNNEAITIGGANAATAVGSAVQSSITVTGDLGAGTNSVSVILLDNTGALASDAQTVNLSGVTGSFTTTTTTTDLSLENDSAITYTGSANNDTVTISSAIAGNANVNTVSISAGETTADADTLNLTATANTIVMTKLAVSDVEIINVDDSAAANSITINASAISGQAIDFIGALANDALVLTGTAGNDVIDLSKFTTTGNQVDFNMTGSIGTDAIVFSTAGVSIETLSFVDNAGKNTVTTFKAGEDFLNFGTMTGITAGTETALAAAAAQTVNADATTFVFADGANGAGGDTITGYTDLTDVATFLSAGLTATDASNNVAVINDLLTNTTYAYLVDHDGDTAGGANTITAGDLTLIGVVNADTVLTIADIV